MQLTRLQFIASLFGVTLGATSLTKEAARFNPATVKIKDLPDESAKSRLMAFEFLRILIEETGIPAISAKGELGETIAIRAPKWTNITLGRHLAVHFEMLENLSIDDQIGRYVRPAALSMAQIIRDEQRRGAEGLVFAKIPVVTMNDLIVQGVSDQSLNYAAKMLIYWDAMTELTMCRFQVLYGWAKQPLRKKKPYLQFDPMRLPA